MNKSRSSTANTAHDRLLAGATLAAFLSPGAWLVVNLPAQPVAQCLHLVTAALWVAAIAWFAPLRVPHRPVLAAGAALLGAAGIALAFGAFPVQQLLYDIYGEMPGMLWLVYPAVFLVAASTKFGSATRSAATLVVWVATALVAVMVVWRWNNGFVTTFGGPAYSVPAIAPLVFVAWGAARTARSTAERGALYAASAFIAAGLAYAGAGLSAPFALGIGGIATLAFAPQLLAVPERFAGFVRIAGRAALALALVAVLISQFPSVWKARVADAGAEQTVATRLYLWEGAQKMVAQRPLTGFGPAGYRFKAVDAYDPAVFSYIAGAGADPTAFSAPSPHSLLWEALTRMGVVGLAALLGLLAVWIASLRKEWNTAEEAGRFRASLAIAFVAYLASLLVTPTHFASGLFGAVVGGFAISHAAGEHAKASAYQMPARIAAVVVALVLGIFGVWRMAGLTTGAISGAEDVAAGRAKVEAAARTIPGEPLNERRRLEYAFVAAGDPAALSAARAAFDASPGYVRDFSPNLPRFAYLGLTTGEALGQTDFSWEAALLKRAAEATPLLPSLVAEQLHLALATGDSAAVPELAKRVEMYAQTYPMSAEYLARAQGIAP